MRSIARILFSILKVFKQHKIYGKYDHEQLDRLKWLFLHVGQKVKEQKRQFSYQRICDFYNGRQDRANQLALLLTQHSIPDGILQSSWAEDRGLREDHLERLKENRQRYGLDASFMKSLTNLLDLSSEEIKDVLGQHKESAIPLLDYMFLEIRTHEFIVFRYLIGGEAISHFKPFMFSFMYSPYLKGSPYYLSREDVFKCVENHLTKENNRFFLYHLSQTQKRPIDPEEINGIPVIDMVKEGGCSQVIRVEASLTTMDKPVEFAIQTPINLAESQDTVVKDYENLTIDFEKNPWFVPETYGLYEEPIEGRTECKTLRFFVEEWLNVKEIHVQENENGRRFIIWHSSRRLEPDETRNYRPMSVPTAEIA